jgi:hypothetical protein
MPGEEINENNKEKSNQMIDKDEHKDSNQNNRESYLDDTLDEPVSVTLKRDLNKIYRKLMCVLNPRSDVEHDREIRNWDLWGPLIICVLLSVIIGYGGEKDKGLIFIVVFTTVWIGGCIITLNAQFLGSKVTLFQSICLLGYCVFPYVVFGLIIKLTPFIPTIVHIIMSAAAFLWASWCKFFVF